MISTKPITPGCFPGHKILLACFLCLSLFPREVWLNCMPIILEPISLKVMTLHISPHSHWIFLLVLFIDLDGFWNGLLNISDQAVIILMTSVLLSESHMFCLFHPQEILMDRPRVISTSVGHAWDMPANTFGAAYAQFMGSRNFSPDDRPPVRFLESEELAYVATRAREVISFSCLVYWFKKSQNIKTYL